MILFSHPIFHENVFDHFQLNMKKKRLQSNQYMADNGSRSNQATVVQTLDSAIHWINHYLLDNSIGFTSVIRWIVICPVDSAIHRLNNWGMVDNQAQLDAPLV